MDRKLPKNLFQMGQKLVKDTFDSTAIIFDHSDHVKAKVDRDVPVQVIRMVIWDFFLTPPPKPPFFENRTFDVFNGHDIFS